MTITVTLPSLPAATFRPQGSPDAPQRYVSVLHSGGSHLYSTEGWLTGEAVAVVGDGWDGPASQAYAANVQPFARGVGVASAGLGAAARAFETYAHALETLLWRAENLAETRAHLTSGVLEFRERARRDLAGASGPADFIVVVTVQVEAKAWQVSVDALANESAQLRTDAIAAEDTLVLTLRALSGLDAARQFFADGPGQEASLGSAMDKGGGLTSGDLAGLTPDQAAAWWGELTEHEQEAVLEAHPRIVGGLDGIPADARDIANRDCLDQDVRRLERLEKLGTLSTMDEAALRNARAVQEQLLEIEGEDDPVTRKPVEAQLYDYDLYAFDGDGRALVSIGDLTTADNVAFSVPGTTTELTSLDTNVVNGLNLYQESRWADPDSTTAALVWIGYDAPSDFSSELTSDGLTVIGEPRARDGGAQLATDVDGFLRSRGTDAPNLTVIGHSYGSTVVGVGAVENGIAADDIILIGSPGAGNGIDEASDLGIGAENVWIGSASTDYVTYLGANGWMNGENLPGEVGLGNDPAEDDFGAQRFQAELIDRNENVNVDNHTRYFDPDTESLANMADIVTGNEDDVDLADHRTDPWWRSSDEPEEDREPTQRSHE